MRAVTGTQESQRNSTFVLGADWLPFLPPFPCKKPSGKWKQAKVKNVGFGARQFKLQRLLKCDLAPALLSLSALASFSTKWGPVKRI